MIKNFILVSVVCAVFAGCSSKQENTAQVKKYDQKRLGKEMIEKARLHLLKQLNSVYFLQFCLTEKN